LNPGWVESFCTVRAFVRTESGNSKVFGSQENKKAKKQKSKKAKKKNTNYKETVKKSKEKHRLLSLFR
jgi:hypothetical protein